MPNLLITSRTEAGVQRHYIPAVRLGGWLGGIQVACPGKPLPNLDGVVGLLLTGGYDIHPRRWDEREALHEITEPDEPLDDLELPLVQRAWGRGLPILGICRGELVLNVALGGSLYQDITDFLGLPENPHRRGSAEVPEEAHSVTLEPKSHLAELSGCTHMLVNSRHHQVVRRVAPGLQAVAWSLDHGTELVEGIEAEGPGRWGIGVQWHPENLVRMDDHSGRAALGLFRGFAAALAESASTRKN